MGDLCINRNNHQKPTFHPIVDFSSDTQQSSRRVNPDLALLEQGLKNHQVGENWLLPITPIYAKVSYHLT
jgi:hypothetical protein